MKMKKNIKVAILIYLGVGIITYALTLRVDRLESREEQNIEKSRIVLRIK